MIYERLADAVLVVHLGFIIFVVLGGLFALRWPWAMWLHLPAAAWGTMIELGDWQCPLTPLENYLRELGGGEGFEHGFIEHYIGGIIYPGEFARWFQISLGLAVIVINAAVYGWVYYRRRKRSRSDDR